MDSSLDSVDESQVWFDPSADPDENGVDLNRLRRNLTLSLEERIERNRRAAITILECRHAANASRLRETDSSL